MKAILIDGIQIGGAERRALRLVVALRDSGYPVKLLVSGRLCPLAATVIPTDADTMVVYDDYPASLRLAGRLVEALRRRRFGGRRLADLLERRLMPWRDRHLARVLQDQGIDTLHIFLDPTIGMGLPARTIVEVTGPDYVERLDKTGLFAAQGVLFHAVNETVHELTRQRVGDDRVGQPPITFFDLARFPEPLPFEQRRNTIVFAHRFLPRKNGLLFARVAARFLDDRPEWSVTVLGKGREEQAIRAALARHLHTGRAVVDYRSPIFEDLARAKVFVSVIEPNNYPSQSVLEALAFGNALLLSDTGTSLTRFLEGNGVSCTLDENTMLAALKRLTSDQAMLAEMGMASRHLVTKRYDKNVYLEHIKGLYGKFC